MHAQNKQLEIVFAAPRLIDGKEKRFDQKRLHAITEQFERKLIGVSVHRTVGSDGRFCIVVAVQGGADKEYLERLWRRHLREHGLPADET